MNIRRTIIGVTFEKQGVSLLIPFTPCASLTREYLRYAKKKGAKLSVSRRDSITFSYWHKINMFNIPSFVDRAWHLAGTN